MSQQRVLCWLCTDRKTKPPRLSKEPVKKEAAQTHASSDTVATFEQIFVRYKDYIYRLAFAMLGNKAEAEDAVQETFLRVYHALDRYDPNRAKLSTWLYQIAVNYCRSSLRRRRVRTLFWQGNPPESTPGRLDQNMLEFERRQTIWQNVDKLSEKHRTTVILHYYLDMTALEIADVLSIKEGTVYSRLHTARARLRGYLDQQGISLGNLKEQ